MRTELSLQATVRQAIANIVAKMRDSESRAVGSSYRSSGTSFEHQAAAYDRAILLVAEECRRQQCDVNESRNASVKFNTLPVEISTEILLIAFGEHGLSEDLRNLLRVSRRWRNLILSTPRFWTRITNNYRPYIIDSFLRNSKSARLSAIFCGDNATPIETFFDLVYPHNSRLQSLELSWVSTHDQADWSFLLSSFSCLQSLIVRNDFPPLLPSDADPLEPLPSLRHLALKEMASPCPRKLIDWLSSLPELRSLELEDWAEWRSTAPIEIPQEAAYLPQLESLVIQGLPRSLSGILMTSVVASEIRELKSDDLLPGHLNAWSPALKSLLELHGVVHVGMSVSPDHMMLSLTTPDNDRSENWKLDCDINTTSAEATTHLQELLRALSEGAPDVRVKLQVGHVAPWSQEPLGWKMELTGAILEFCPNLEVLWVGQDVDIDPVLDYLAQPKKDSSGAWTWACPMLSEIWVRDCELSTARFFHLAKTRWEVPGSMPEFQGLRREKLRRLQAPPSILSGSDGDRQAIQMVLKDCCEDLVHGPSSAF